MKTIVTMDLDSTTCDTGHRHHIIDRVNGTDWDAYSKACVDDRLIEATATLIRQLKAAGNEIHYVTGRTEAAREETVEWLYRHELPVDGLWMDDTPDGDHFAVYGGHAQYKVARVKHVEETTGGKVILHVDDWSEVKVALEEEGVPCICVRTPQEVMDLVNPRNDNKTLA